VNFTFAKQKFHISPKEKYFTQGISLAPRLLLGEAPAAAGDEGTPRAPMLEQTNLNFYL
jgi:hypothetical protein